MRTGALLGHILTDKERLIEDVKVKGSLCFSAHEMSEFKIQRSESRAKSKPYLQEV